MPQGSASSSRGGVCVFGVLFSVAAHCLHTFSILAPDSPFPEWRFAAPPVAKTMAQTEQHSTSRPRHLRLPGQPPPAPRGPGPRRRLRPGRRGAPVPGARARAAHLLLGGPHAARPADRRLAGRPGRDQGAAAPPAPRRRRPPRLPRGPPRRGDPVRGADRARGRPTRRPGVREGGVLEHVTREVTVEALPTEIPEQIVVDVSEMVIGDTITLAAVSPPAGVKFMVDDPEEITIATLSPPRVEEEPEPELEEEAELVGEDGEPIEPGGRGGRRRARRPRASSRAGGGVRRRERRRRRGRRVAPVAVSPPRSGATTSRARRASRRRSSSASATPASRTRRPATTSASRSPTSWPRRWDLPQGAQALRRPDRRGPRPARAARASRCCCPRPT